MSAETAAVLLSLRVGDRVRVHTRKLGKPRVVEVTSNPTRSARFINVYTTSGNTRLVSGGLLQYSEEPFHGSEPDEVTFQPTLNQRPMLVTKLEKLSGNVMLSSKKDRAMATVIAKIVMDQGHSSVYDSVKKKEASPLRTRRDYGERTASLSDVELAVLKIIKLAPGYESTQVANTLKRLPGTWRKHVGDVDVQGMSIPRLIADMKRRGLIDEEYQSGMGYGGQEMEAWPLYLTDKGARALQQRSAAYVDEGTDIVKIYIDGDWGDFVNHDGTLSRSQVRDMAEDYRKALEKAFSRKFPQASVDIVVDLRTSGYRDVFDFIDRSDEREATRLMNDVLEDLASKRGW